MYGSLFFFFFKQKTAYEMRISDWSSDVCSSDLRGGRHLCLGPDGSRNGGDARHADAELRSGCAGASDEPDGAAGDDRLYIRCGGPAADDELSGRHADDQLRL